MASADAVSIRSTASSLYHEPHSPRFLTPPLTPPPFGTPPYNAPANDHPGLDQSLPTNCTAAVKVETDLNSRAPWNVPGHGVSAVNSISCLTTMPNDVRGEHVIEFKDSAIETPAIITLRKASKLYGLTSPVLGSRIARSSSTVTPGANTSSLISLPQLSLIDAEVTVVTPKSQLASKPRRKPWFGLMHKTTAKVQGPSFDHAIWGREDSENPRDSLVTSTPCSSNAVALETGADNEDGFAHRNAISWSRSFSGQTDAAGGDVRPPDNSVPEILDSSSSQTPAQGIESFPPLLERSSTNEWCRKPIAHFDRLGGILERTRSQDEIRYSFRGQVEDLDPTVRFGSFGDSTAEQQQRHGGKNRTLNTTQTLPDEQLLLIPEAPIAELSIGKSPHCRKLSNARGKTVNPAGEPMASAVRGILSLRQSISHEGIGTRGGINFRYPSIQNSKDNLVHMDSDQPASGLERQGAAMDSSRVLNWSRLITIARSPQNEIGLDAQNCCKYESCHKAPSVDWIG